MKVAILDDYQRLALKSADWERLRRRGCEVSVFTEAQAISLVGQIVHFLVENCFANHPAS